MASKGFVTVVPSPAAATPETKLIPADVLEESLVDVPEVSSILVARLESFLFDCS